jgi:hypothetical protein
MGVGVGHDMIRIGVERYGEPAFLSVVVGMHSHSECSIGIQHGRRLRRVVAPLIA